MPIPALLGWIGGLSAATKLTMASSVVSGLSSYAAAKQQRKQAIADQDNQYVRMRNAAQRAGFNPLTVLRNTGGQGFTGLPVISKAAAFGNIATGIFDVVRQAPIDKYNEEIRELEKQQRQAELALMPARGKLMKAELNQLRVGVPQARTNVLDQYDLGSSANQNLATFKRNVTTDEEATSTQTRVMSDGTKYTGPAGQDLGEMFVNTVIYAGEQFYQAGQQLSSEGFKALNKNKPLNPNLPILNKRLQTGALSKPVMEEKPGFGEQWHMYAP